MNVPPTSMSIVFIAADQPLVADLQLARVQALAQPVEVDLDVVRDRVPGRQVLGLDLGEAARAVELDDPHPVRVGRERVLGVDQRLVDLARVALVDLAAVLVVLARRAEVVVADAAVPALARRARGRGTP